MRASIEQLIIQFRRLFTQFTLNIKEHVTIVLYCAHIYSHKIFAQQESQSSLYSKEKETLGDLIYPHKKSKLGESDRLIKNLININYDQCINLHATSMCRKPFNQN